MEAVAEGCTVKHRLCCAICASVALAAARRPTLDGWTCVCVSNQESAMLGHGCL